MANSGDAPLTEPTIKTVTDLANDLTLAREEAEGSNQGRGRAIFLVGAGCSVTAGIPAAPGVAKHCALKLARVYSGGEFTGEDADAALEWLQKSNRVELSGALAPKEDGSHWGALYSYFFEFHLKSPNQQREVINEIIDDAEDGLNWAHACLGELVERRYVHTVLTTNFDQLVLQGIIRTGLLPVTADGLEALNRITGRPKRPQVVHLHGSMHTYNLRNSRAALSETSQDPGALSMVHGLLQQCDLLVVVGYAGGEEGIMALLRDAARTMPQLVIYWVTYQQGHEGLSRNARELLSGENKFSIWGGSADKFFGDLMAELKIGQPRWVADPITVLKAQSERLRSPEADLEDVRILVNAFKERVTFADRPESRWPEADQTKVRAADKRSRGEFLAARELLEQIDLSQDLDAARLHALNAHSIFEQDPTNGVNMLSSAVDEFEDLVGRTEGQERLDNILSLCAALLDRSEAAPEGEATAEQALRRVVELVRQWLPSYPPSENSLGNARLNLFLALALQSLAESSADQADLAASEEAYNLAIGGLVANKDPDGRLSDAKSGLAAVLQVRGETDGDPEKLRRAVALQRELVEASRGAEGSKEEAGPLENLAGSLVSLAGAVEREEAEALYDEAKSVLERVIRIHQRQGENDRELLVRGNLDEVETALAAL
jgi:hypothetical protein